MSQPSATGQELPLSKLRDSEIDELSVCIDDELSTSVAPPLPQFGASAFGDCIDTVADSKKKQQLVREPLAAEPLYEWPFTLADACLAAPERNTMPATLDIRSSTTIFASSRTSASTTAPRFASPGAPRLKPLDCLVSPRAGGKERLVLDQPPPMEMQYSSKQSPRGTRGATLALPHLSPPRS